MCGINGFIQKKISSYEDSLILLEKMNNQIIHRGPDQEGFFHKIISNLLTIGLAMRRLSIIDLKNGNQPIFLNDKSKVIVFNGEIYNYIELKNDLLKKGYEFITNTDTEVIINLFQEYGVESFSMLDGMFAFSLFDLKQNKVFLVRDFFGEKPLYYSLIENNFYFSSELKSIVSVFSNKLTLSKKSINLYFTLGYIASPFTIYNEVSKLEANSYCVFDCNTFKFDIFNIKAKLEKFELGSKNEILNKTHDLVFESVISRTISDVNVGSFLSGGVDSSIVSLCLSSISNRNIDTFSAGFEDKKYNELDKSRIVAKIIGSNHHEIIIRENDLIQNIDEILLNFDEPFADSSAIPSYAIAKKTSSKIKVALNGDGGDEVFGGYNKYYMGKLNSQYTKFVSKDFHNVLKDLTIPFLNTRNDNRGYRFKIKKAINSIDYNNNFYYNIISLAFKKNEINDLLKPDIYINDPLDFYKNYIKNNVHTISDFRNIDRFLSLEGDLLVKTDRTTMLCSLESRSPFLTRKLWNFSNQLPESLLIKGWDKKYILKESFKKYFPNNFLNKPKKGFGVPVGDWLRSSLKKELIEYINPISLKKQNIFNIEYIQSLVFNHIEGKVDNTFKVWAFYCFQKWYYHSFQYNKFDI